MQNICTITYSDFFPVFVISCTKIEPLSLLPSIFLFNCRLNIDDKKTYETDQTTYDEQNH